MERGEDRRWDMWSVKWVETHNCGRSREHRIAVASRDGTYRLCVIKHDEEFVEYVQRGGVPVLQYRQARHNLRSFWDAVQQ
jgi:hypothetical protein